MRKSITLSEAHALLRSRDDLRDDGHSERDIRALVAAGRLLRVRRDRYADAADFDALWSEGRHLVHVVATHLNSESPGPVFWGPSAAVLHGLPLYRLAPANVHTAILGARHGRTRAGTMQHNVEVPADDIVEIDGIRCTSLDRTILDLACTVAETTATAASDAAVRGEAVVGHVQDPEYAAAWHARMAERARLSRAPGIRRARWIVDFADGRAQLPGESVSRLHLHRLGYRGVLPQVHVRGSEGDDYWMDFAFPRSRTFGEFDGRGKYLDDDLRGERTAEQAVLDEKRREDDVRGVTGWRFARWEGRHIATAETLGRRLAAFGVHPPG
ncbi:hypothetical protein [Microbacterium capsulatum]|uniref:Transcriptional regulator, AbiEi antitoxin, Type IV TA system n=1 Tax=Microbacterium capsulatum TaxID=3041921 RepID=A0ABU0XAZ7_9MICO|nr:hypothetical protein [Microbacterium sp. ASV81]MDQ4212305.1 hypothetical protein [Microbacterium sp. ASV81]